MRCLTPDDVQNLLADLVPGTDEWHFRCGEIKATITACEHYPGAWIEDFWACSLARLQLDILMSVSRS